MGRYKKLAVGVVIIIGAIAVIATVYLRSSLPIYEGNVVFTELLEPVEIVRDENAIPHISAKNSHDLYFALGVVHAQDRLWQLEKNRRVAKGTLAEVFGEAALENDKFLRTLGTYEAAKPRSKA